MSIGDFVDIYFSSKNDYTETNNNSSSEHDSESSINQTNNYPSICGATLVPLSLSKNSEVINGNYFSSNKSVDNTLSNVVENEKSFSTGCRRNLKICSCRWV
ncbi:MAG: hypothetical protein LBV42_00465 [Methanobrevibacter sp.]|jgi:hypothetical protein|nr:hypothetical protein [Methanobrevibacter sp.]